jgi:hypothetical protein
MQQRNLGKAMRYVVVVGALASAFAMVSCGGDGDNETTERTVSNVAVPVSANTVQAMAGQPFPIPDGSAFSPGLPNTPVTLTFTSSSTFTLTGGGTATGTVAFGSCTFTISNSNIAGLTAGTVIQTFTICNLVITAIVPLEAGGDSGQGTVALQLGRNGVVLITIPLSNITITVSIDAAGHLVINGTSTDVIIPPTTGTTGTGGTP